MTLEKVEGFSNLRKDTANGGVVNVDYKSYSSYKAQRLVALQKQEETKKTSNSVTKLENEINNLKDDMQQIKSMLLMLIEKGK